MKRCLFLDRDGVVNIEKNYVYRIEDFEFIDGIFDVCRYFQAKGYLIVIITNQAGIARKYYSLEDYNILTGWMVDQFRKNGITIHGVYHCPHHPDITGVCECRKPKPGMIFQAKDDLDIDLEHSILIGDKMSDIEAGINAGIQINYFFSNNYNEKEHSSCNSYSMITISDLKKIISFF